MSKNMKQGLVPELRFPEFRDVGAWRTTTLIDVADKNVKWSFIGGPFGSNLKSSDYVSEGVRIIQLQNIGDGEFRDDYQVFTSEEKANELLSNNIYPGDIILSKMGDPVGRACLIPATHERYLMCSDGIRLVVDKNEFSKYFIYILINSDWFRASVEASATGSTRKRIGLDVLKKLPLVVPKKIEEQQKIADCMSSLDELIAAHTQKHQELQSYKKGLLQNLFPTESETVPALRFPEFDGSSDWEIKPFSESIRLYRGSSPRPIKEYLTKNENGVNWIKIGDTSSTTNFTIRSVSEKITPKGAEKSRKVKKGELILANSMSYGATYLLELDGCIYDGWFVLREYEDVFNREFLLQLLNSTYMQEQYKKLAAGGIVQNISSEIVYSTLLPKPSIKEQQRIANFLSSVDDLINAQAKKVEELKAHKKGLMAKLFPAVGEVL